MSVIFKNIKINKLPTYRADQIHGLHLSNHKITMFNTTEDKYSTTIITKAHSLTLNKRRLRHSLLTKTGPKVPTLAVTMPTGRDQSPTQFRRDQTLTAEIPKCNQQIKSEMPKIQDLNQADMEVMVVIKGPIESFDSNFQIKSGLQMLITNQML
jgi:hypothetical protein